MTLRSAPATGTPSRSRGVRVLRVATGTVAALVLAFSAFLVVIRFFALDTGTVLAAPVAGLPWVAAGTIVVLLGLLVTRRRLPVLLAAVLVVIELTWLVPRFVPTGAEPRAGAVPLRVAVSNTYHGRVQPDALLDLVRTQRVDVLALVEVDAAAVQRLTDAGLRSTLRYGRYLSPADIVLFSRYPLSGERLLHGGGSGTQLTATVTVRGRRARLIAVHAYYPLGDPRRWANDLAALREQAAGANGNLVMLGDFNSTLDHTPLRAVLDTGLVDTHAELGHGWAPTWPEGGVLPPLVQLDHVLHGPAITGRSAAEFTLPGTDHRAVVTGLAIGR